MTSGYELNMNGEGKWSAYQMLFMADNGETNAAKECLFPIIQNTEKVVSYGNSFFLTASTFNGDMHANPDDLDGTNGCVSAQWAGNRARPELIKKFFPNSTAPEVPSYEMTTAANDDRAIFCGEKRNSIDINNYTEFKDGYGVCKFINYFTTDGKSSYNPAFSDADYFFLRVAEAYLTYAEADARLNGNNTTGDGTDAINKLRQRANTTTREEPDYDKLMRWRLSVLKEHGLGLKEIQETIASIDPLPGAKEFLDELRSFTQVIIIGRFTFPVIVTRQS